MWWMSAALLLSAACSSSSGPAATEPLPATSATVIAGVNYFADSVAVLASCSSNPAVNCPDGTPGLPIHVPLTVTALTVTPRAAPDTLVFDWAADVKIVSPPIPITLPVVGACMLTVDTRAGTDTTVHVTGTATFSRQTAGGPIDRVDIASGAVTGLTAPDLTLSGGIGCVTANVGIGAYIGTLTNVLTGNLALCSATGPALLEVCKQQ